MPPFHYLNAQFSLIEAIRKFFKTEDFTDVLTPPMVSNPGMETHIHPYQIYSAHQKKLQKHYTYIGT